MKHVLAVIVLLTLSACGTFSKMAISNGSPGQVPAGGTPGQLPVSVGEKLSGYTYIPMDPLPVSVIGCATGDTKQATLASLADNTVRIVVRQVDESGNLSVGVASVGVEGKQYQVVLDYINSDITNVWLKVRVRKDPDGHGVYMVERVDAPPTAKNAEDPTVAYYGGIPVYIGVGLRLIADIKVTRGTVQLASLGAIAAAAESGNASGSLVVQTLGITGKQVSTALPLPSEINQTTVQNAILSLGAIKTMVNSDNTLIITPRVVGMYLPFQAPTRLLNGIISELASKPTPWKQICR